MVLVWHPRCRQAAPGLLQTTMQIEWPTMSKMQNDCFGMTGLDNFLVDWCDCFFQCCMFYGWGGHRRWASRPRGPSGFKLLFYVTMGLTNSRFRRNVLFALAPHVNVRKQNLDSQNESETCTIFSVRSRGGLFFTQSCTLLLTLLQHCAPSFAQNRFVMYITHVHRYVCYVFYLIMYKISFLCWLGQSLSMFATICYNNMKVCSCRCDKYNMRHYWVCDLSHSPNLKLHP